MTGRVKNKSDARQRLSALGIEVRCLSLAEAAAYVGLSPASFKKAVRIGAYPAPVPVGGRRPVWDRAAIDRALDRMGGIGKQPERDHVLELINAAG